MCMDAEQRETLSHGIGDMHDRAVSGRSMYRGGMVPATLHDMAGACSMAKF